MPQENAEHIPLPLAPQIRPMHAQPRLGDILANAITHGVGAAFALAGAAYLIYASTYGNSWLIVSCSIYGSTLILVYICSTLYHSLVRTRARRVFHILDHSAIYLLIAGTYTPFTLVSLRGPLTMLVRWLAISPRSLAKEVRETLVGGQCCQVGQDCHVDELDRGPFPAIAFTPDDGER